ncbi:MAG: hypothetical protein JWM78_432 [Verrucomicrobiaceae bacterium]|nr:hypothetical protein [Verrucomicrobiaceae bacterium]
MMSDSKRDVFKDHTVEKNERANSSPPGPAIPGEADFEPQRHKQSPGFSSTPGAGPNPTPTENDEPTAD